MYLGIDFLITSSLELFVIEVNVGLPGGAHEYNLTHLVHTGTTSDIFERIEKTSQRVYGKPFGAYLHSLPFVESLKELKIWMDGMGPLPTVFHPGLRFEDKWNQYQLLKDFVRMPKTMILNPKDLTEAIAFLEEKGTMVLKRRVGRGGRGFRLLTEKRDLLTSDLQSSPTLIQEYVESKVDDYSLSIRSVAFAGEFMCLYANLASRPNSNHGILVYVSPSSSFGLREKQFKTQFFNLRSWEAEIWFRDQEPSYLKHNLYEEEVAEAILTIPFPIFQQIREISVTIERLYEKTDPFTLPAACFEA